MDILIAFIVVGAVALVAGILLALISRFFGVPEDKRVKELRECLPGINCGACGYKAEGIFHYPAAYNRVVWQNECRNDSGKNSYKRKSFIKSAVCLNGAFLSFSADCYFSRHKSEAESKCKKNIHKKEDTAVFCGEVGETPNVSEPNRRACRSKYKSEFARKRASFFSHSFTPKKSKYLKCYLYNYIILFVWWCYL